MSTCRKCGEEITFRYIDGVCTPIHLHGYCEARSPYSNDVIKKAVHARCPHCGQMAYFLRHNGGTVWVDELGPPWPKHKCSNWEPNRGTSTRIAAAKPNIAIKRVVARTDLKQCPLCPSKVRVDRYDGHLNGVHKKGIPSPQSPVVSTKEQKPLPVKDFTPTVLLSTDPMKTVQSDAGDQSAGVVLDEQGRRRCEFCTAMVKPLNYGGHVKKVHEMSATVDVSRHNRKLLKVNGIGGSTAVFDRTGLSKLPQQTIAAVENGTPVKFQGVLLADVLAGVTLPTGDKFRHTASWYYLLAEALDGNRAVFAWAELDSSFMDRKVYVVHTQNGHPLPESTGPFQLVIPGEKRTTRWLGQVTALKLKQAN